MGNAGSRAVVRLGALIAVVGLVSACSAAETEQIDLLGFAVPAEANAAVFDAFTQTEAGQGAEHTESYGASGDKSRAVVNGQPADFVHFSIDTDMDRLVEAEQVAPDWDNNPAGGHLTESVVVLVVREGNPKQITDWEDLVREDVEVVTPNPGSSGAARWNILAAWASQIQAGHSEQEAAAFLTDLVDNVVAFPGSGRDATTAFLDGTGDVLLSYENEAIFGRQQGETYEYVVPERSLLIQNPAAVTVDAHEQADDFLEFAASPQGQQIYAAYGFRPVGLAESGASGAELPDVSDLPEVQGAANPQDPFPQVEQLATMEDFGGWEQAVETYFAEDGLITEIIENSGAS